MGTAISNLHEALYRASRKISNPVKDSYNPHLKNKYASLGQVIEAIKTACAEEGVIIIQDAQEGRDAGSILVRTIFIGHGESLVTTVPVVLGERGGNAQGSMAAFSYGRRFGLLGAFCLATEDNDGEELSEKLEKSEKPGGEPGLSQGKGLEFWRKP